MDFVRKLIIPQTSHEAYQHPSPALHADYDGSAQFAGVEVPFAPPTPPVEPFLNPQYPKYQYRNMDPQRKKSGSIPPLVAKKWDEMLSSRELPDADHGVAKRKKSISSEDLLSRRRNSGSAPNLMQLSTNPAGANWNRGSMTDRPLSTRLQNTELAQYAAHGASAEAAGPSLAQPQRVVPQRKISRNIGSADSHGERHVQWSWNIFASQKPMKVTDLDVSMVAPFST